MVATRDLMWLSLDPRSTARLGIEVDLLSRTCRAWAWAGARARENDKRFTRAGQKKLAREKQHAHVAFWKAACTYAQGLRSSACYHSHA